MHLADRIPNTKASVPDIPLKNLKMAASAGDYAATQEVCTHVVELIPNI